MEPWEREMSLVAIKPPSRSGGDQNQPHRVCMFAWWDRTSGRIADLDASNRVKSIVPVGPKQFPTTLDADSGYVIWPRTGVSNMRVKSKDRPQLSEDILGVKSLWESAIHIHLHGVSSFIGSTCDICNMPHGPKGLDNVDDDDDRIGYCPMCSMSTHSTCLDSSLLAFASTLKRKKQTLARAAKGSSEAASNSVSRNLTIHGTTLDANDFPDLGPDFKLPPVLLHIERPAWDSSAGGGGGGWVAYKSTLKIESFFLYLSVPFLCHHRTTTTTDPHGMELYLMYLY